MTQSGFLFSNVASRMFHTKNNKSNEVLVYFSNIDKKMKQGMLTKDSPQLLDMKVFTT